MTENPPVTEGLTRRVQQRLVEFVRLLRANGFPVGVAEEIDAQRVALHCGIENPEHLRWGLRGLLCAGREEWERFEGLFEVYWMSANTGARVQSAAGTIGRKARREPGSGSGQTGLPDQADGDEAAAAGRDGTLGGASLHEILERGDFQSLADSGQMRTMERLVESLARGMRKRLVRRERVQRKGARLHLRHTIRNSLPQGGTPLRLAFRQRRRRQPRLIVITDVSRSMSMYSFLFLRFARGIVAAFSDSDAFAFHTRLVRITDALRQPDQTRVTRSLALVSQGWSGGTRLGESLAQLNRDYRRLLNRRTLIILVSDGLDTGEPSDLARQLAELRSRCRRLVWLNPLLGRPGYEPLTGGMQAALPHLDLFAPAHNLRSLAALEPALAEL